MDLADKCSAGVCAHHITALHAKDIAKYGCLQTIPGAEGLATAVTATEELDESEKITLFAPSNEAFEAISLEGLDSENILDVRVPRGFNLLKTVHSRNV